MNPFSIHPYAAIAAGVVFLGLLGAVGWEHVRANLAAARADKAELRRGAAELQRDQVIDANVSQQATITAQGRALDQWAAIGVTPAEVATMVAQLRAKQRQLEELVAMNQRIKEKDDANPDCEKLRQVDFGRLCPHRAGVLRGYESGLSRPH